MDHLANEFIRGRRSMTTGRGKRYPESLRRLAVGFATRAQAAGWSGRRIAQRLGVTWPTLERWCAQPATESDGEMLEVVVRDDVPSSASPRAVLVTPEGYRIEGLEQAELVELLRALRR